MRLAVAEGELGCCLVAVGVPLPVQRMLGSMVHYVTTVPYMRLASQAAVRCMAGAVGGRGRVHFVLVGNPLFCKALVPVLLKLLRMRPEGPPHSMRITTVDHALRPQGARELRIREEKVKEIFKSLQGEAMAAGVGTFSARNIRVGLDTLHRLDSLIPKDTTPGAPGHRHAFPQGAEWTDGSGRGVGGKGEGAERANAREAEEEALVLLFSFSFYCIPDKTTHGIDFKEHIVQVC